MSHPRPLRRCLALFSLLICAALPAAAESFPLTAVSADSDHTGASLRALVNAEVEGGCYRVVADFHNPSQDIDSVELWALYTVGDQTFSAESVAGPFMSSEEFGTVAANLRLPKHAEGDPSAALIVHYADGTTTEWIYAQ